MNRRAQGLEASLGSDKNDYEGHLESQRKVIEHHKYEIENLKNANSD